MNEHELTGVARALQAYLDEETASLSKRVNDRAHSAEVEAQKALDLAAETAKVARSADAAAQELGERTVVIAQVQDDQAKALATLTEVAKAARQAADEAGAKADSGIAHIERALKSESDRLGELIEQARSGADQKAADLAEQLVQVQRSVEQAREAVATSQGEMREHADQVLRDESARLQALIEQVQRSGEQAVRERVEEREQVLRADLQAHRREVDQVLADVGTTAESAVQELAVVALELKNARDGIDRVAREASETDIVSALVDHQQRLLLVRRDGTQIMAPLPDHVERIERACEIAVELFDQKVKEFQQPIAPWDETKAVYNANEKVSCYIGRSYKVREGKQAVRGEEPGEHPDVWERDGTHGIRLLKSKPEHPEPGDLYADNDAHFLFDGQAPRLIFPKAVKASDLERSVKPVIEMARALQSQHVGLREQVEAITQALTTAADMHDAVARAQAATALDARTALVLGQEANEGATQAIAIAREAIERADAISMLFERDNAEQEPEGTTPVKRWAGYWKDSGRYARGEMVTYASGLYLSLREGNTQSLGDRQAWGRLLGKSSSGGGSSRQSPISSPFNVVGLTSAIPAQGAGDGDTYFSFEDRLLRIWDATAGIWRILRSPAYIYADKATMDASAAAVETGAQAWVSGTTDFYINDGARWNPIGGEGGLKTVATNAALYALAAADLKRGDAYLVTGTNRLYIYQRANAAAHTGDANDWQELAGGAVMRVATAAAVNALPNAELPTGRILAVDDLDGQGTFGLIRRNANARANTLADFEVIIPTAATNPVTIVQRAANLPIVGTDGVTYLVKEDNAGNPLAVAYYWDKNGGKLLPPAPVAGYLTSIPVAQTLNDWDLTVTTLGQPTLGPVQTTVDFDVDDGTGALTHYQVSPAVPAGSHAQDISTAIRDAINALAIPGITSGVRAAGVIVLAQPPVTVTTMITGVNGAGSQPPGQLPVYSGGWMRTDQRTYMKTQLAAADQGQPLKTGDLQFTTEADHSEIKVWNGTTWIELFTEDEVREWIAAGSLFQGTVDVTNAAGAEALHQLPTPGPTNRGAYWSWSGPANYAIVDRSADPLWNTLSFTPAGLPGAPAAAIDAILDIAHTGTGPANELGVSRTALFMFHTNDAQGDHEYRLNVDLDAADTATQVAVKMQAAFIAAGLPASSGITLTHTGHTVHLTPGAGIAITDTSMWADGATPGVGIDLAGEVLQKGDWIQSNGNNWIHVSSDLLSKIRGDRIYGLLPWQDGAWESGALVYYDEAIYRARSAVIPGDNSPNAPQNPVTIPGTRFAGLLADAPAVTAWQVATPATPGNAGVWVVAQAAGTLTLPQGGTINYAAGDGIFNTGTTGMGTEGYVNLGHINLPPAVAAHDVVAGTNVGPIATQAAMNLLPGPDGLNTGAWALVTANLNGPQGVGQIPAGSTIMVLENPTQGTAGYQVVSPTGGVTIRNQGHPGDPIAPGHRAIIQDQVGLQALADTQIPNTLNGEWYRITGAGPYTAPNAGPSLGNLAAIAPTLQLDDALVLVDNGTQSGNPVTYVRVAHGANIQLYPATFIGIGSGVTTINGVSVATPPANVPVPEFTPPPTINPSYSHVPTAANSKWDRLNLRAGLIAVADDTLLPAVPPTEDTLVFVAHSARQNGQPGLYRWDVARGDYISIFADTEHPIYVAAAKSAFAVIAPTQAVAVGYAVAEREWGTWSAGAWSWASYWETTRGNMAWKSGTDYFQGAICYLGSTNSWYTATQNVPAATPAPNDPAAAAYWRQIGGSGSGGSTVFFGRGDFDATRTTQADNWGMPVGTFPQNVQPLNGDAYFDVLSGTTTQFTVTANPPTNLVRGRVDKAQAAVGDLSLGVVAGKVDYLTFAVDGQNPALAKNAYYTLTVPGVVALPVAAGHEDWATSLMPADPGHAHPVGYQVRVTGTIQILPGAAGAGWPWDGNFSAGDTFIWTGLPWMTGADSAGQQVRGGWMRVSGYNPATTYTMAPVARASAGHFLGTTGLPSGSYLVVWSNEPAGINGGWAVIQDAAPYDWTLQTNQIITAPDTVVGTNVYGWRRNFQVTVPAGVNTGDTIKLLSKIPKVDGLYNVIIKDRALNSSFYEFKINTSQGGAIGLVPVDFQVNNNHLTEIRVGLDGTENFWITVKAGTGASGHVYDIVVKSDVVDLTPIEAYAGTVLGDWGGFKTSIDAVDKYPSNEMEKFLQALSGDPKAASVNGNPEGNQQAASINLEGGKLYKLSGSLVNQSHAASMFISFFQNGINTDKLTATAASDKRSWAMDHDANNASVAHVLEEASAGFLNAHASGAHPKINSRACFELQLDLRNPSLIIGKYRVAYTAENDHVIEFGWDVIWANPTKKTTGFGFYFSNFVGQSTLWNAFND